MAEPPVAFSADRPPAGTSRACGTSAATRASPVTTVSKNATSSAEVRTARTPTPPDPHASITARRESRHPPWPAAAGRGVARWWGPTPVHSPSQTALDRSTQRSSPDPGGSPRSRDRSAKYSWSPGSSATGRPPPACAAPRGRAPGAAPPPKAASSDPTGSGPEGNGAGNRSSGSGHAAACTGSRRAALTRSASRESW